MLKYYGRPNTFYCISDTYVFHCFESFYGVIRINDSLYDTIISLVEHKYPICTIIEFEKAFITDLNDDDNIYLYLKIKGRK